MPNYPKPTVPAPGTTSNDLRERRLSELRAWQRVADREKLHKLLADLKAAGLRVNFRRTQGTTWMGNGFGTANAEYNLVVNGAARGSYDGSNGRFDGKLLMNSGGLLGWKIRCCEALYMEEAARRGGVN